MMLNIPEMPAPNVMKSLDNYLKAAEALHDSIPDKAQREATARKERFAKLDANRKVTGKMS